MNKLLIILILLSSGVRAQVTLSPDKPKPGEKVSFTYTPPAGVFTDADKINCVVYKWGTYCDENDWKAEINIPRKAVEIILKKKGNQYIGAVQTDTATRMLSFSFKNGEVKWKQDLFKNILIGGKIDNHGNEGYCFPFYQADGSVCQFSNYMIGNYLLSDYCYDLGINNPRSAAQYLSKEMELFPSAKYYAIEPLLFSYKEYDKDMMKRVIAEEMEKLFAGGLKSWEDIYLMSNLSLFAQAWNQYEYFQNKAVEKAKESKGTLLALCADIDEEKDVMRQQEILDKVIPLYNQLGFKERLQYGYFGSVHNKMRSYLYKLAASGKIDDFKKYADKTNFYKGSIPFGDDIYFFRAEMDTLIRQTNSREFTEKFLLDLQSFYAGLISNITAGKPYPALVGDAYYTTPDKINVLATVAAVTSDYLVQLYTKKGDEKSAWKYAIEVKRYVRMITVTPKEANEWINRYCLLAEKNLPDNECKTDVEKFISEGIWKTDMVEILKRYWVKMNKSENGFEAYIKTLRKSTIDEVKKETISKQLNYPAPLFALKDLEGKLVSLQDLAGKTVVLDFWATWCGPCKGSFPAMQKLVNHYKDDPNVIVLFIDTWQKEKTEAEKYKVVSDFIKSKNYTFQVLLDNESTVVKDYKVSGIPTKIIIDKKGNVRYNLVGAQTNEGQLLDEMEAMIESIR